MKNVSEVICPVCAAPPDAPCVYEKGARSPREHEARYVLARGYVSLVVGCESCDAEPGALCRDLRTKKENPRYNVNPHYQRDHEAHRQRVGKVVRGLRYKNGKVVREGWISADRTRKRDGVRSVHVREIGGIVPMWWASTPNGRIWFASTRGKTSSQRAVAARDEASPIDLLGDLKRKATTIWVD